ncbi:MAG: 2-amino-4-hydroxy-6-hydroxymethyldihydropteridine diphosphokinase [Candidatus Edwardsbacteria bacterium RIFOXYD12_FULL_50_11]|jgi:2-amino-4-hydroxy-6-hydroxymethyldihydropteridine diphosphokinase|uniref:2-amino-4-hydroxy-6-hydroxymethyldihydropteridine diphosphokinase n=1 Tax=Candidatus Edwardsbacteria bacterium GWF2_54_11 TaxID=1817851 RepID=A0A1F5RHS0_9BACT|nr:MAG: 2-amino-4-hydroxy-6-hydroxymethyldihydropteridine diphosphokinase [Candidatus Edwardsbacteria bacterium RifOxyC12_full_54_24]OGF06173.1 MAG: 2-amino-4-hydroxy-6-hydroxymethyldihydropteridine diphosphokinase [Candidatus Edwardsbacteria bacterium RifOxyA12_full_54_48]OGF13902.1 MAG: 2-amino-4-hydroxy-6-hydroxymethyldihydropteridine diphosphokinase [Candidatus Edwardsbacteria bacterium GWF2_54_11]OGF17601.1 MAG: 2-amino-4-hydroxy-6-hydroxymethyldihydropteridine diphosphokinase [Candidatus E
MKISKEKAVRAYIGLGSNLGKRLGNIRSAIAALEQVPGIIIMNTSSVYETEPVGNVNQPKFLNSVMEIETRLPAAELLISLQRIEKHLGRKRQRKDEPRIIDLDILYYDQLVTSTEQLTLPHAQAAMRAFVMVPLLEIAPDLVDPSRKKKISEILAGLDIDGQGVRKLDKSRY